MKAVVGLLFLALFGGLVWLWSELFEYSLWCFTGADIPGWLDVLGGLLTSGVVIPVSVGCCIAQYAGAVVPFFGG